MIQDLKIGKLISDTRKQKGLTQKELCKDLCSQSMLSAIENNQYRANAELFIGLCKRLEIDLNAISLGYHYPISKKKSLIKKYQIYAITTSMKCFIIF